MPTATKSAGYLADAIANEFLSIPEAKDRISPMKIQKLVYFAHGWHLALYDTPLVSESVQAWKYGPVFPSLYAEFREFGRGPINRLAIEIEIEIDPGPKDTGLLRIKRYEPRVAACDRYAVPLIQKVWEQIGSYSAVQLSTLTHRQGTPWHAVASEFGDDWPSAVAIPNELIKDYFKRALAGIANG